MLELRQPGQDMLQLPQRLSVVIGTLCELPVLLRSADGLADYLADHEYEAEEGDVDTVGCAEGGVVSRRSS
jgi:hypothetical protein